MKNIEHDISNNGTEQLNDLIVDIKLEAVIIPVSNVDRAKQFYASLGWRLDADFPFAAFSDPDGNSWLLQEVTTRLAGRINPATITFSSASELASGLRRASAAHGQHEKRIGHADPNWPDWYADYMLHEQTGDELPS